MESSAQDSTVINSAFCDLFGAKWQQLHDLDSLHQMLA
jgi:hypothetical protein